MDFYVLPVINLYKHNIIYKKVKKKSGLAAYAFLLIFGVISAVTFVASAIPSVFGDTLRAASSYFSNPVSPLYQDSGAIIFTNATVNNMYNVEKDCTFTMPIISSNITVENSGITFEVIENVLVRAACDGVVTEVGVDVAGNRFITIKHTKTLQTRYENIDIAAVAVGDEVKDSANIATAKVGAMVKFCIIQNGNVATNYSILDNTITWKN